MSKRAQPDRPVDPEEEEDGDELAPLPVLPEGLVLADLIYMDNGLLLRFFTIGRLTLRDLAAMARADTAIGLRMATLTPAIVQQHPAMSASLRATINEAAELGKIQDWGEVLQWLHHAVVLAYMLDVKHDDRSTNAINVHELVSLECARLLETNMSPGLRYLRLRVITDHVTKHRGLLDEFDKTTDVAIYRVHVKHGEALGLATPPPPEFFWTANYVAESYLTGAYVTTLQNWQSAVPYSRNIAKALSPASKDKESRDIARLVLYELVAVGYYDNPARARELDKTSWLAIFQVGAGAPRFNIPFYYMTPARMGHLIRLMLRWNVNDWLDYDYMSAMLYTINSAERPDLVLAVLNSVWKQQVYTNIAQYANIEWIARLFLPTNILAELVGSKVADTDVVNVGEYSNLNAISFFEMGLAFAQDSASDYLIPVLLPQSRRTAETLAVLQRVINIWPTLDVPDDSQIGMASRWIHAAIVVTLLVKPLRMHLAMDLAPIMPALRRLLALPTIPPIGTNSVIQAGIDALIQAGIKALQSAGVQIVGLAARLNPAPPHLLELLLLLGRVDALNKVRSTMANHPVLRPILDKIDPRGMAQRWADELRVHGAIAPIYMPLQLTPEEQVLLKDVLLDYLSGSVRQGVSMVHWSILATVPHPDVLLRVLDSAKTARGYLDMVPAQYLDGLVNNPAIKSAEHITSFLRLLTGVSRLGAVDLELVDDLVTRIWFAPDKGNMEHYDHAKIPYLKGVNMKLANGGHVQWMALVARQLLWTEALVTGNVPYAIRGAPVLKPIFADVTSSRVMRDLLSVHWRMFSDYVHFEGGPRLQAMMTDTGLRLAITTDLGRDALTALRFLYTSTPHGVANDGPRILNTFLTTMDPSDASDPHEWGRLARFVVQLLLESLLSVMPADMLTVPKLVEAIRVNQSFYSPDALVSVLTAALREARGIVLSVAEQLTIRAAMEVIDE